MNYSEGKCERKPTILKVNKLTINIVLTGSDSLTIFITVPKFIINLIDYVWWEDNYTSLIRNKQAEYLKEKEPYLLNICFKYRTYNDCLIDLNC